MTLFSKITDKFYDSLETLTNNQNHIVSIIDAYKNQFEQLFFLHQQKDSLESFEKQIDILIRTITLTNKEIPNLEIITFKELQEIQNELLSDYDKNMLISYDKTHPFEILQNSRLGIVAINNLLVMALKVPILNPTYYNISKIYPTPNKKHISLVPPAKYYLENYLEDRWTDSCQSIIGIYICQDLINTQCMLKKQSSCDFAEIKDAEAYKLTSHGILTIFSKPKEVIEKCQNIISRRTLHLNNMISSECPIIIDNNLINAHNQEVTMKFDATPKFSMPEPIYELHLQSPHLDKISRLKEDLRPLEKDMLLDNPVFNATHVTTTVITTLCILIIVVFLCIFRQRLYQLLCAERHIFQLDPVNLETIQTSLSLDEDAKN